MITVSSSSFKGEHASPGLGPSGLRFRSILVATDCSVASATAVKLAARLAKEFHAKLHVVHAIMPEIYEVNMPSPELEVINLPAARENLHKYAEHISDLRTVKHTETVILGTPGEAIQSAGEANRADLLVLGSHGRGGLAKLALGSVAEWAIRRLPYPVLVAGPNCEKTLRPIRSIVLATDFSEHTSRSAQYASSMAQDFNARLTLMNVISDASSAEEQARVESSTLHKLRQLLPGECEEWCTLKAEVKTGDVAAAVLETAQESKANLIVLGARHRSALADHVPGTKLSAIIRGAHCPVLVVPAYSSLPL